MFATYKDIFAPVPPGLPPERPNYSYKIDLVPNTTPPAKAPYRLSTLHNDELKKQLDTLLKNGWIRQSRSPYAAPVLFTSKKDSGWRMCVDYRDLNTITVKNKNPLPRIKELLDRLGGNMWFSKLDLASGYHQIRMDPADVLKTAFTTRYGNFEWLVLPFGLANAPAFFMQLMQEVLSKQLDRFVVVFLDDILVFSRSKEEHEKHLTEVLETLKQNKLYAKKSKCSLFQRKIEFLGYTISAEGLSMEPNKVQQIKEWPTPTSVKQVRQFLGLAGFYRSFIKDFSSIASPLSTLMKINTRFEWLKECNDAFNQLKQCISSEPVLMLPREREPFYVQTDASKFAIGGVLMQHDTDGQLKPLAYYSRKLQQAELNYPTHDLEMLAVIDSLKQWKHHVLNGTKTTVITDHHSLRFFNTQQHLSPRQTRWMEFMSQFDVTITYKPGVTNTVADALSRRPDHESPELKMTTENPSRNENTSRNDNQVSTSRPMRINLNTTTSSTGQSTPNTRSNTRTNTRTTHRPTTTTSNLKNSNPE